MHRERESGKAGMICGCPAYSQVKDCMRCAVRIFKDKEDSLIFGLSFFMLLGAVCGSVFCNAMNAEMKKDLQITVQSMINELVFREASTAALFGRTFRRRMKELFFLLLISSVPAAGYFRLLFMGYWGLATAMLLCPLTMNAGLLGIVHYFILSFPQCFFYIAAVGILFWWMPIKGKNLTVASAAFLTALVLAGVFLESVVNPACAAMCFGG